MFWKRVRRCRGREGLRRSVISSDWMRSWIESWIKSWIESWKGSWIKSWIKSWVSDSFKYDLTIIIRKLIKSLSNSTMHVFVSRETVNNLYNSIHFFWCVLQINIEESIEISYIFMIWGPFRWCKTLYVYFLTCNLTISFIVILITLTLLMINRLNISSLMIRKYVPKINNVKTRLLYSAVSLIILTIIYRRIFLIKSWSFNSIIMIRYAHLNETWYRFIKSTELTISTDTHFV